jgi:tRNA1Val (adenine37-N6)-methyltransferase
MTRMLHNTPYKIVQSKEDAYNLDALLLSNFINIPKSTTRVIDLGTGNGVILFYMSLKTKAKLIGYDIIASRIEHAKETVALNQIPNMEFHVEDINQLKLHHESFIISNPPYFKVTPSVNLSESLERQVARHEVALTLEQLISKVSSFLRTKGKFYMIHRADRLQEIMSVMRTYQLSISTLQMVHSYPHEEAIHVLIEAVKEGNRDLKVLPPFILYESKHTMTEKFKAIYGGLKDVTYLTES